MRGRRLFLGALLGLLLVSCRPTGETLLPTPFPTPGPSPTPPILTPIALSPQDLAAAPGLYRDVPLNLSGLYRRGTVLVCDTTTHVSPATWAIEQQGVQIQAGGFDQELRSLLPDNMTINVEGRWRRWEGLVGCGKQAQPREVWYLEVSRILSPSPLVQVTLTPGGVSELAAVVPTPELATPELPGMPTDIEALPTPETTFPTEAYPIASATSEEFAPPEEFDTPTAEATPFLFETPTLEPTVPFDATATPFGQPTEASATPISTSTSPTATTMPGEPQLIDQGDVFDIDEEIASRTLDAGTAHGWTIEVFEDETFTLSVIAAAPADLILTVMQDGQMIINKQNNAAAGQAETVVNPDIPSEGTVDIIVQTTNGVAAEYALATYYQGGTAITFMGFLNSGAPQSNVQLPEDAAQYWFFTAGAGSRLTSTLTPDAASDIAGDLYGPGAEYLEYFDEGIEGEVEQLTDFPIPSTGLHSIRVSDIEYSPMTYTIVMSLQ